MKCVLFLFEKVICLKCVSLTLCFHWLIILILLYICTVCCSYIHLLLPSVWIPLLPNYSSKVCTSEENVTPSHSNSHSSTIVQVGSSQSRAGIIAIVWAWPMALLCMDGSSSWHSPSSSSYLLSITSSIFPGFSLVGESLCFQHTCLGKLRNVTGTHGNLL